MTFSEDLSALSLSLSPITALKRGKMICQLHRCSINKERCPQKFQWIQEAVKSTIVSEQALLERQVILHSS